MSVKLKVLHGAIAQGGRWQLTVPIRETPFRIGQAADCNMRCYGQAISDHHCEIRVDGLDVFIRDLNSQTGTFVNGHQVEGQQHFRPGDQLRLGQLGFELLVRLPAYEFDELISDMLLRADEADRQQPPRSPESRWYQIEPLPRRDPYEGMTPKERLIAKAREKLPPKQAKPGKLPKRAYLTRNTKQAVSQSLAFYYASMNIRPVDDNGSDK